MSPRKRGLRRRLTGGCACGAVRYELRREPMVVHCCHCSNCQKQTGSAFVLNAIIETAQIHARGPLEAVPVPREHGPHDIHRCPKCRVALWSDYGRRPGVRYVRVGTLDDPAALRPDVHIYTRVKQPWVKLPKGVPAFRGFYPKPSLVWSPAALARWKAAVGTPR